MADTKPKPKEESKETPAQKKARELKEAKANVQPTKPYKPGEAPYN